MAATHLIAASVSPEMKARFRAFAEQQQMSESALLKQLADLAMRGAGVIDADVLKPSGRRLRGSRTSVRSGRRMYLSPAQIELIHRTVTRTPEVMVKVTGGAGSSTGRGVVAHFNYIGRGGDLEIETDEGERLVGKGAGQQLIQDWDLDMDEDRKRTDLFAFNRRKPPRLVHKIIFSMPAGTPPKKVVAAVRDFAREEFGRRHRYAMVLHTDEPHPHVHVVVKAVSEAGVRLNISRETLQHWRREFARQLRAQGVEANATERRVRGQSRTSKLDSIFRAAQRGESSHMATRVRDVVRELKAGSLDQSCNMVFDDFMAHCESRMSKSDLSFAALESYRKILKSTWRPEIGEEFFEDVKYSRLAKIVDGKKGIGKKTYNNIVSVIRCAFEYGYRDNPEKHNPAAALKCFRLTKKDRPPPDPFSIHEAEALIAAIHLDWGEAQGNYDEFRFFTGLRPSEQIALLIDDCDTSQGKLKVSKARVMKRDKDRTKTGEDGTPISDLNHPYDRWRWTLLMTLKARYREAYNARHSFVSWNLMLGKNLLWVAKQMATACRQCWRSTASGLKAHSKPISKLFVVRWKRAREELPSLPFFVTPRVPESPQNLAVVWQ